MDDVRFDRTFRTPSSEGYHLTLGGARIGSVDLHFTATAVHATLIIDRALEKPELAKLIEQIDEDLVLSADVPREDFLVNVFQGQEIGFYSDDYRADDEGVELPDDADPDGAD
ncbi:MAG TPA: hypothetical protein VID73_03370 [Ktedonobacterales bacterium]